MFKDKEGNTWVNTGDIVRETESGNYEYVGRKKRNFVSGIENIYPEQIEDLLTTLPEINEVVVTCVPNDLVQYLPIYHNNNKSFIKAVMMLVDKFESLVTIDSKFTEEDIKLLTRLVKEEVDINIETISEDLKKGN